MLNWYHKKAPKNTIVRYLSSKYSPEELQNLTYLELPEQFESLDYADELNLILKDSPWKASEVKYKTSSLKSLKGIFTKEWWFGKKQDNASESSVNSEEETPLESVYFEAKESDEETSSVNDEISIWDQILDKKDDIELAQAKLAGKAYKESWETEEGLKDWIRENEKQKAELENQILLTYQFRLNQASLIVLWKKAEASEWEEEPYQGCFLDLNKTYQNCWVTIQTIQPLPTELPQGVNCLFELVATKEELIEKEYWDYGLVIKVEPVEESESESSDYELSESEEEEITPKGTFRYEFKTDNQGLIINWRTPSSEWKTAEIFQGKYFSFDITRYANSYLKVKTLEPLPRNLSARYLFAPCLTKKDFYSKEPNWTSCLVWEQSSLEPIPNHHENHEETPTNLIKWWNNNKNWVIIAGITVLLILLWKE